MLKAFRMHVRKRLDKCEVTTTANSDVKGVGGEHTSETPRKVTHVIKWQRIKRLHCVLVVC